MKFFNVIHERLIKLETFCVVVLSDVWPLYTHTFKSNEFASNWVKFILKTCKVSIYVQYMYNMIKIKQTYLKIIRSTDLPDAEFLLKRCNMNDEI